MSAGMMPALDLPGLAMPGQLGPMMRVVLPVAIACAQAAAVSCTGTPSVMTTASGIAASMASTMAALVPAGGTKMTLVSAPVSAIASATVAKTGSLVPSKSTCWPALRGLVPPTTWAPAASMRRVCLAPSEPVMPWTMILLFSVSQTAMSHPCCCELGGATGRTVHCVHPLDERVAGPVEDPAALVGVVAVEAHHERLGDVLAALGEQLEGLHDAVG